MRCKSNRDERGSALLIVFVFAAIVAIMLYKAMPDVVFEAQRQKEQILMDRGHEYKIAIKRFLTRNKTYPTSLEQLDNFNNLRYIRRRYKDPMTGQNEWRLIHVMTPGFILTDSKVTPLKNGINGLNGAQGNGGGFAQTNSSGFGGNNNSGVDSNQSSFGSNSNRSGFGSNQSNQSQDDKADPNAPPEPTAAQLYGAQRRPPATPSETMPGGQNTNPDESLAEPLPLPAPADGQPTSPGAQQASGAPGANPGATNNSGAGPGIGGGRNADPNNPAASALNAVNSSLRQQGPTPMPAARNNTFGTSTTFGTISGGGIAGVASKAKGSSIKVMDGQTDYSKWEFVYNPQKDAAAGLQGAANRMNSGANRTQNSNNSGGFSINSSSFNSNSSSFGSNSSSSFGSSSSGFGSSSSGFGSSTQSQSRTPSQ